MKFLNIIAVLGISLFALSGCIEDDYGDTSSYSDSGSSGGSGGSTGGDIDALAGSTYTYSWTCDSGSGGSVQITSGSCSSSQEYYARVFACNEVSNMRNACESFYGCLVNNSTGEYQAYYQQNLDYCSSY